MKEVFIPPGTDAVDETTLINSCAVLVHGWKVPKYIKMIKLLSVL